MTSTAELGAWVEGQTVTAWFRDAVLDIPDSVALRAKGPDGSWAELTWADVASQASRIAAAFGRLGVRPGDRVLLFVRNRPEFHVADLAALLARATPVSVYNSSAAEQIGYLAQHSGARVVVVDDLEFLGRVQAVRPSLPDLHAVVVLDDPDARRPADVHLWADLLADPGAAPADIDEAVRDARGDDLVTVIYTSGTTGNPKGVMLDHSNVAWQVAGYTELIGSIEPGLRSVSYLPMAHVAERMVTHYGWLWQRSTVTCCPDLTQLGAYLAAVHPHNLFGPPRVWEKLRSGILAAVAAKGPQAEAQFARALAVGAKVPEVDAAFAPVRAMVGLDQLRYAFSGAAPLPVAVFGFFQSLGLPFSEIYGMSENCGGMTWTPYDAVAGTVGRPYPGAQVVLDRDGEVLCRGGMVSRGYLDDPERTAETFDSEGWLHTGDIGQFDPDGNLRIVDRKKELIITAGGKNVSPANLEALLKAHPLIGQAAVVGDGRPYLVALLVLDSDVVPAWAAAHDLGDKPLAELVDEPTVLAEVERAVAEANSHVSNVEHVRRWALLAEEWLPDSEILTATMKLKRRGVLAAYGPVIDGLYS